MSTVDLALQRVARLDETYAAKLLAWMDTHVPVKEAQTRGSPLGAHAMIGFAHRAGRVSRTTEQWMTELREGDRD